MLLLFKPLLALFTKLYIDKINTNFSNVYEKR